MRTVLLKLLPWYLLLTLLLCAGSWWHGHHIGYDTAETKGQVEINRLTAQIASEREASSEASRLKEQEHAAALAAASTHYQEELKNAKANSDRLVADLRAGNVKLQDRWHACVAASVVPSPAGSAGADDAGSRLRAEGEGSVLGDIADQVRDADEADAWIKYLQSVVRADRAAMEKKP